ncbi:MAG: hypothetical protein AAGI07_02645 [Bacteroidota bacterium]
MSGRCTARHRSLDGQDEDLGFGKSSMGRKGVLYINTLRLVIFQMIEILGKIGCQTLLRIPLSCYSQVIL